MCPNCRAFVTTGDRECPYCEAKLGDRAIDRRMPADILGGLIPHARFTTVMILVVNFGFYLATAIYSIQAGNEGGFMDIDGRTLYDFGAKFRDAVLAGHWWRLITAGFLHGGMMHIVMNSWVLFDLGTQIEELYGTSRLLAIYFVSTVSGFMASTFWSSSLSVGASAGIFGLLGAMLAYGMTHRTAMGAAVKAMYGRYVVYGLLFGLIPMFRVDNAAHLGGLAGGFCCSWLAGVPGLVVTWKERFWRAAAGVSMTLTVMAFLQMFVWFTERGR